MKATRFVYDLMNEAHRDAIKAMDGEGANFPCPLCSVPFRMKKGENACPNCGKIIDLVVSLKIK